MTIRLCKCQWLYKRKIAKNSYPITDWASWNATKSDLIELVPLAIWLKSRVEEVRRVGEHCCSSILWTPLAHKCLNNIHRPAHEVGTATDCSWTHWSTKRSLRGNDIQEVMESIIDNTERIKHCKQVIPNKHLEHSCREEES